MYSYSDRDMREILNRLKLSNPREIFESVIPNHLLLKEDIKIDAITDDYNLKKELLKYLKLNKIYPPEKVFASIGVEPVYIPSIVKYLISRGEFLTSYTPYQPEISQGVLQALFEYQSVVAELTGMDVVNSSMYDWSSAVSEALLMSIRVTGKNRVLIPDNLPRNRLDVIKTYLSGVKAEIHFYSLDDGGEPDISYIEEVCKEGCAGLYIEYPDTYGYIYMSLKKLGDLIHSLGGLYIVGVDIWTLPLLTPPSSFGADIVVGEGQPYGLPMNYGGPLLGIFAVRGDMKLIRQMPGRIIGLTKTLYRGERAYTMILQTREQHIRREKATSNICTNEALTAIQFVIYVSTLGKDGLINISLRMLDNAHYLYSLLNQIGFRHKFNKPFFRRFTVTHPSLDIKKLYKLMLDKGYLPGYITDVGWNLSVNMFHNYESIKEFYNDLKEVVNNV